MRLEERSPLKKRSGSSKSATRRKPSCPQVTLPDPKITASTTSANRTTFLDNFVYPYPCIILKLKITLKSDKAFEKFTQALMAFISNAQMFDPKFVINPLNTASKEKSTSSKAEVSPNMTKLGIHIKISGNDNAFSKKKIWSNQDNDCKSCKSNKEEFRNPTVYFSMVVSTEVMPQIIIDQVFHEWAHLNGSRLQVKDLQSISSETIRWYPFSRCQLQPLSKLSSPNSREFSWKHRGWCKMTYSILPHTISCWTKEFWMAHSSLR